MREFKRHRCSIPPDCIFFGHFSLILFSPVLLRNVPHIVAHPTRLEAPSIFISLLHEQQTQRSGGHCIEQRCRTCVFIFPFYLFIFRHPLFSVGGVGGK